MKQVLTDLPLTTYASLPDDGPIASVAVLFHGYGADALDLFNLSLALRRVLPQTAFYFPNAPEPLAVFGGFQWFDLNGFDPAKVSQEKIGREFMESLMPKAQKVLPLTHRYMDAVMDHAGVGTDKTALCGFSQGGLMALYTALTYPKPFAAAVGLSAVAVMFDGKAFSKDKIVSKPPVTLVHGDADNVLPLPVYETNKANLESAGLSVEGYVVPDLMHGIDQIALTILSGTLTNALEK